MTANSQPRRTTWTQNPDAVRADILDTATGIFAEKGFSGARIDEIVKRTRTSKRMIYYYFGGKEGLYMSVLEAAYARLRAGEDALCLDDIPPGEALRKLVGFSFDFHREHPDYVRLIAIENIHHARNLAKSETLQSVNVSATDKLREICKKGVASGEFRSDIDPVQLHWLISSSCVFNVTNQATFSLLHGGAIFTDSGQEQLRELVIEAICGVVAAGQ